MLFPHFKGAGEILESRIYFSITRVRNVQWAKVLIATLTAKQLFLSWAYFINQNLLENINLGCNPITAEVQGSFATDLKKTRLNTWYRAIQVVINKNVAGKKTTKSFKGGEICKIWGALFFPAGKPLTLNSFSPLSEDDFISTPSLCRGNSQDSPAFKRTVYFVWCKQLRYCIKEITILQRINSVAAFNFPLYKLWWAMGSKPRPHVKQHGTSYRPYGEK